MPQNNNNNERFNLQFAEELADIKLRMQLMNDAINALDTAMRGTFDLLIAHDLLPAQAAGLKEYDRLMKELRKLGLKSEQPRGKAAVKCPGCKAALRVAGEPGDRCEWCGFEF